jgi:hypothetical protein
MERGCALRPMSVLQFCPSIDATAVTCVRTPMRSRSGTPLHAGRVRREHGTGQRIGGIATTTNTGTVNALAGQGHGIVGDRRKT